MDFGFGFEGWVSFRFAELEGAGLEEGGSISLGDGKGDEQPAGCSYDELDPVQPTPTFSCREEAAHQWTNGGSDEGRRREEGHGHSALLSLPKVGERAANEGHGGGDGDSRDGAADEKRTDVLGEATRNDENGGEEESGGVDNAAAEELGEGREGHWTNAETDDKEGYGKKCDFLGDVKLLGDANKIGGDDSRVKGDGEACQCYNDGAIRWLEEVKANNVRVTHQYHL